MEKLKSISKWLLAAVMRFFWRVARVRFDVDPKLKRAYRKIKNQAVPCPKHSYNCSNYVGCGPEPRCDMPCPACLFWTGYGLRYDYKDKCEKWCSKNCA